MTKYFYDTEFHEDGSTIDLISIGIVAEDGREYYAVNSDMDHDRISTNDWLCQNVVPHLPLTRDKPTKGFGSSRWIWSLDRRSVFVKPKWVIANEVREFLRAEPNPELWADFSAYDHVALAQLWGKMIHLPAGLPMYTRDFQQRLDDLGRPEIPEQVHGAHDALADAHHLRRCFEHVSDL
ncbi:3'-5' exoribonuclease domain-containing protein [Rhodococcus baikonurensis]|uniref:3'-5' exoribonuclease domain-containing protein n=1 Tax=Rhodococcus baikonurensis TaxID=172041 RepID=UPI0037ACA6FB